MIVTRLQHRRLAPVLRRIKWRRVEAAIAGQPVPRPEVAEKIELPANISDIRREDPDRARVIQAELADRFESCFARGLAVIGIEKNAERGTYLFGALPGVLP